VDHRGKIILSSYCVKLENNFFFGEIFIPITKKKLALLFSKVKLSHYMSWNSFSTLALEGGEWSASHPSHALPLGKVPWYPLDRKLDGSQSQSGHRG
jgi:hypothetical protein